MAISYFRIRNFAALGLVPVLLSACGGELPPCREFTKTVTCKTVELAQNKAEKAIRKEKKHLAKKYKETLKFEKPPTKTCTPGLDPKDPALNEIAGKKAKKRAKKAKCDVVIPYCVRKPKKPKADPAVKEEAKTESCSLERYEFRRLQPALMK